MKAKVYKIVLSIVDLYNVPEEDVRYFLENVKYLYPSVISLETRDIEEWDDNHPLNQKDTFKEEFERLFNGNNQE
jgi:hypothetical protein